MSNWKVMKLSEVATIVGGGTPSSSKSEYFENGNIPWITPKDLSGYNKRYISKGERNITELGLKNSSAKLLPKNTVLLTSRAPIGYVAIASNEISTNQGFKSLVLNNGHIPEFFYYLLKNNVHILESRATGSTFKEISGKILKDTELSIPTPDIQQKIVDILSPLDDKIELNTQINQTLEQIAQALFKSWFVDFDPARAKVQALSDGMSLKQAELAAMQAISGKTPEELTALSQTQPDRYAELAETAKAFPCEMVEVDGVEVPKGWELKPFGSLLENTIGGDWGKEEEDEKHTENVFVFRGTDLPNVQTNEFDVIPKRYIAKNKLKSRKAKYGDIIIEVSGGSKNQPTGRSLLITKNLLCNFNLPIIPASFCRLFTPINEKIAVLLACHLKMIYTQGKTWEYQVQSTGISNFQTKNFLENELVVIPDENIFNAFYEKVGVIFEKMTSNENMLLSKTRDLLLPRLLNGKI